MNIRGTKFYTKPYIEIDENEHKMIVEREKRSLVTSKILCGKTKVYNQMFEK